jgi:periplasmic protein TonB
MLRSSSPRSASTRFVAALFASALTHALLSSTVKPGSARGDLSGVAPVPAASQISARLVLPEVELASDPLVPPRDNVHVERPVQKPQKTPRAASPAVSTEDNTASAGPAEVPDPTYYAARQLDIYPALVSALDIRVPGSATPADANGYVLLLVLIDATGVVENASIVEARPPGQFDEGARDALKSARFRPAMRQGRAVKSRVLIHVNYGAGDSP